MPMSRRRLLAQALASSIAGHPSASGRAVAAPPKLRLGVLQLGTVRWELEVIKRRGLDRKEGVELELLSLAGESGPKIALEAGEVDLIVSDWFLVPRQRASGDLLSFFPYSRAVGSLMVVPTSPFRRIRDLAGARIGIAGGALDKSWLILLWREDIKLRASLEPALPLH
jgi:NitT/TauT family transport system substrate-binding protein